MEFILKILVKFPDVVESITMGSVSGWIEIHPDHIGRALRLLCNLKTVFGLHL